MFTGIVQGTGRVREIAESGGRCALRMQVELGACAEGLQAGHSVAVNGVCLTVVELRKSLCSFEMIQETLQHTSMGSLRAGDCVNIERSMRAGDRIEGHFVLGHVDGTGIIESIREEPGQVRLKIRVPPALSRHMVRKGSVAVDGISLTITETDGDAFGVSLIPHTVQITNFGAKKAGDHVNIETDILGKYVLKENLPE